jgi:hypothetical protein
MVIMGRRLQDGEVFTTMAEQQKIGLEISEKIKNRW